MSTTLIPIRFADGNITIVPHTATYSRWLDTPIKIQEFLPNQPIKVFQVEETGEYFVRAHRDPGLFIEGPEVQQ